MMDNFLSVLKGVRKSLTWKEYRAIRKRYLSGDEDGAIRALDNIFRKKLREYVKKRGIHNG